MPLLLSFIRQMAEFEKVEVKTTPEILRESLFGKSPAATALLVYAGDRPTGYITYFFTFASMTGKRGLWLDDIFILPEFRGQGLGKVIMAYLAQLAVQNGCARFEWIVLDWNQSAQDFYRGLGAAILPDWRICRLNEDELTALARG